MSETTTTPVGLSGAKTRLTPLQRKAVIAGAVGNGIEYFDWAIYSSLTVVFAPHFFPSNNPTVSILAGLAAFAVGFIARPIGAIVFGRISDHNGRKVTLTISITITSCGALLIALTPDYSAIGIAAPLLLLLARLAQGFGAGGESSASSTFLVEMAPPEKRGFVGSFQQMSVGVGLLCAALVSSALTGLLSQDSLNTWGWRAAFVLAAALGFVVLYLRRHVDETEAFKSTQKSDEKALIMSRRKSYRSDWPLILKIFLLTIPATIGNYVFLNYFPTYAHISTGIDITTALLANSAVLIVYCIAIPLIGLLSDRVGRKACLYIFTAGFAILPFPIFSLLDGSFLSVFLTDLLGAIALAFFSAVYSAFYNELFPPSIRATATAIPFAIAVAAFGGTAPYISTALVAGGFGNLVWIYVSVAALVGLAVTFMLPETLGKDIDK